MLAKQVLYSLGHTSSPFCSGYFGDRVSQTVCLGWPQTMILLISASQIVKITGVNHQCLTSTVFVHVEKLDLGEEVMIAKCTGDWSVLVSVYSGPSLAHTAQPLEKGVPFLGHLWAGSQVSPGKSVQPTKN
jgi:hypothetical protein